ncbi:hypothetical protein CVIRNUC_000907 [Coccomyxa viridis]|uniref:Probable RuBisCO transcriptional regulator n=1 Tax=Coccomyxa viridis TaxID=1274662 RepID=A0AAV1HV26_9CHLO|nr:hypothetical protein CVIRNUC_000907 [Coccomyxa viridis]
MWSKRTHVTPLHIGSRSFTADGTSNFIFPFTLQQLIVLRTLALSQTLEEAAAAVAMSESNIRATLGKLEKDLDVELLQAQDGKKAWASSVQLTDAGQLLLRYAERLLALSTDAITATRDVQEVRTGSIYLAASQTTGVYLLPRLIERYKKSHPEVLVHLLVENTRRCCAAVARGEVNLAIVGGDIPRELEHLIQVRPYQEDEVVLIVGSQHRFASRTHIDKDELLGLSFVSLHRSSTVQGIKNTLVGHGVDWKALKVVMEVNSVEAIKSAVEANLGAAFVSAAAVAKEKELGNLAVLRIQDIPLSRTLQVVTDPARYCSKAAMALIREMFGLSVTLVSQGCLLPLEEDPASRPASFHSDVLHSSSNGHVESQSLDPGSSFQSGDSAGDFDSSYEPILGQRSGPCGLSATASDKIPFTLSQLIVFRTVALTGNGSAAALALSVSKPAISKSLSVLEQAFGGALTVRPYGRPANGAALGTATWLTEAGQALLPLCNNILEVAAEAVRAVSDLRQAHTGRVMLAASQTVGTYVMPRLLAAFQIRNPGVAVHLMVEQSRRACSAVANGEADCAIIGGDVPDELAHVLKVTPYASDELVLIVPRHHELAKRSSIAVGELQSLSLVSLNQGSSVQMVQEKILRQHGIKWHQLKITMEFNSVEAIKGAVQYGLGAAFISSAAITKELDLGLFKRIDISGVRLNRTLSLVSSPTREPSFAAQKFMLDVFLAMPGLRATGDALPLLFRNAASAPRPWEARPDSSAPGPPS